MKASCRKRLILDFSELRFAGIDHRLLLSEISEGVRYKLEVTVKGENQEKMEYNFVGVKIQDSISLKISQILKEVATVKSEHNIWM